MADDEIVCPLIEDYITAVDCMENRDLKDECIPDKFKEKINWKNICKNCKYQNY